MIAVFGRESVDIRAAGRRALSDVGPAAQRERELLDAATED
jgi:hypothetical protein